MFARVTIGLVMIGLMSLTAVAMLATDAQAGTVCTFIGGVKKCTTSSGSVKCHDLTASQVGNPNANDKYVVCSIAPPAGSFELVGVIFCRNKGQNVPAGVNSIIPPPDTGTFEVFQQLTSGNTQQGNAEVDITVKFLDDPDVLAALEAVCDATLNPNYTVAAFVPCSMTFGVKLVDNASGTDVIDSASAQCTLPVAQCGNFPHELAWDKTTNAVEEIFYVDSITGELCQASSE